MKDTKDTTEDATKETATKPNEIRKDDGYCHCPNATFIKNICIRCTKPLR